MLGLDVTAAATGGSCDLQSFTAACRSCCRWFSSGLSRLGLDPKPILFIDPLLSISCVNNLFGFNNNYSWYIDLPFWFKVSGLNVTAPKWAQWAKIHERADGTVDGQLTGYCRRELLHIRTPGTVSPSWARTNSECCSPDTVNRVL
jgi:hypothetical protein